MPDTPAANSSGNAVVDIPVPNQGATSPQPGVSPGVSKMDPTLVSALSASFGLSFKNQADDTTLAIARQRDATQLDNRVFAGFIATELFTSQDPEKTMDFNTAIRTPSTIEHPAYVPGTPQPAVPPAATKTA